MKKIILLLTFFILVMLIGCTKPETAETQKKETEGAQSITPSEAKEIAKKVMNGDMVWSLFIPKELLSSVFMPVALGAEIPKDASSIIGTKFFGSSVNGYPCCGEIRFLNKKDTKQICDLVYAINKAVEAVSKLYKTGDEKILR